MVSNWFPEGLLKDIGLSKGPLNDIFSWCYVALLNLGLDYRRHIKA